MRQISSSSTTSATTLVLALLGCCAVVAASQEQRQQPLPSVHCENPKNAIVAENCRQGSPSSEWDVNGAGDPSIQGFSTDISYNVGDTAKFKIDTPSTNYRIDIYRFGYYGGMGARLHATVKPLVQLPHVQPPCRTDNTTWEYECHAWDVTAEWPIPKDTVSGVFVARLVRMDGQPNTWRTDNSQAQDDPRFAMPGGASMKPPQPQPHAYGALGMGKLRNRMREPRASHIYFVVRNDASTSDIVVQTADLVWQAYNNAGGTSTYGSIDPANPRPRCYKASLNRPLNTRHVRPVNAYLGSEYPIDRFLEANGYDVTYMAGVDTDRYGARLLFPRHKVFISQGHDEYWSQQQRDNVEAARDKGMHLVFLSGNEMYWRVRWEDNYRTMVVYKESQSPVKIDPVGTEWTGTFRDSRPINPLGPQPENAITGTIFTINAWRNDPLVVPGRYGRLRQWRGTKLATMMPNERTVLFRGILGHEMDEDIDNGFRPAGLIRLSETEVENCMYIQDFGSTFDSGSATHHLVMYRAPSGAIVFGAGTVQWGWALDGNHDSESGVPAPVVNHLNTRVGLDIVAPDVSIQQFTVNFLADMGAQPATLYEHLQRARGPHDTLPPVCHVDVIEYHPESGTVTVSAFASDVGGHVAAVEIKLPGDRWHPANPASEDDSSWYYQVTVPDEAHVPKTAFCRAVDDSLNIGEAFEFTEPPGAPETLYDVSGHREGDGYEKEL